LTNLGSKTTGSVEMNLVAKLETSGTLSAQVPQIERVGRSIPHLAATYPIVGSNGLLQLLK
jgi:hypothetical protein